MILYRLVQDWGGILEGACVSREQFMGVFYTERALFEPISDYEFRDMIEYVDKEYCAGIGIEKMLFYNEFELQKFIDKIIDNGIPG